MIIVFPSIIGKSFSAISIYPFIFLKNHHCKGDHVLINHERIHLRQQIELLWLFFFILYISEYFIKLIYYRNSYEAYKNLSFEKEAYANENNLDYLKNRKFFSFLKYY